ncbi:MAG: DUF4386 domain-containing protein [Gammaproteobacteria bacterium]|nr:DUF4386 domain-containing protein [Gammaproteobacteria bacterium]
MGTAKGAGRTIGVLLLVQIAAAVLVNLVLIGPVITVPPGFLVNAAASSLQVSLAVLVGLAAGALSVGIAIAAMPVFRQYSHAMALWLLVLAAVSFALTAVENTTVLSMLSLSQTYATANAAAGELFQTLRVVVASARNWAHYINLIFSGAMFSVFYAVLYRFALIPRALAAFGLAAVMLQLTAVTMPLFGRPVVFLMLLPLGLSHLALALWLIVRGFGQGQPPASTVRA